MNDTDHATRLARLERIEAFLDSRFPEWNATKPTPAPHPLAGLEYQSFLVPPGGNWTPADFFDEGVWKDQYTNSVRCRDATTHAPVSLWQVAKRLGVEHPVPEGVRWTDVEYTYFGPDYGDGWGHCSRAAPRDRWGVPGDDKYDYRLTAQYDHQPITYAQFREILGREDKVETSHDFRVGDLVEVVDAPERSFWGCWFRTGERFVVDAIDGSAVRSHHDLWIGSNAVRLISRP